LEAQYATPSGIARWPAIEPMLITRPDLWAIIGSLTALTTLNVPVRLIPMTLSHSSAVVSRMLAAPSKTPALLTRTSMPPWSATTSSARA
jgi:hypothetical protein